MPAIEDKAAGTARKLHVAPENMHSTNNFACVFLWAYSSRFYNVQYTAPHIQKNLK